MSAPLLFVWITIFWLGGPASCPNGRPIGKVERVTVVDNQPIQIRKAGQTNWLRAEKGTELCQGDQIRTRYQTKGRVKLKAASKSKPLEVVLGVNTRIRTIGDWYDSAVSADKEPILDVVHGVTRIAFSDKESEAFLVRTGPLTCRLAGKEVLSNWDPFKAEANHLVVDGVVLCPTDSSVVEARQGAWIEVVRGRVAPPRKPPQLLGDVFDRATTLK